MSFRPNSLNTMPSYEKFENSEKSDDSWIEYSDIHPEPVVHGVHGKPGSQITKREKLDLLPAFIHVLLKVGIGSLTTPFRGEHGADTYSRHLFHYFIRQGLKRYSVAQLQCVCARFSPEVFLMPPDRYMTPSFVRVYKKHCERNNMTPEIVDLDSGAQGFWLGRPEARYTMIYSHGGGFGMSGDFYHLAYLERLRATAGPSLSIFVVAYTLTPFATYPQQIREALSALTYVLAFKSASQVILGGDSSGGNLCLAVISHLLHPHPELEKLNLKEKLRGMILISPWVSFDTRTKSNEEGKGRDIVVRKVADKWIDTYVGLRESDLYMQPAKAELSWWKDAPVEETLICAGGSECLRDSITVWVGKWEFVNPCTTFVLARDEVLDAPIYDSNLPGYKEMETEKAAKQWLKQRVEWRSQRPFRCPKARSPRPTSLQVYSRPTSLIPRSPRPTSFGDLSRISTSSRDTPPSLTSSRETPPSPTSPRETSPDTRSSIDKPLRHLPPEFDEGSTPNMIDRRLSIRAQIFGEEIKEKIQW